MPSESSPRNCLEAKPLTHRAFRPSTLLAAALLLALALPAMAQKALKPPLSEAERAQRVAQLSTEYKQWLSNVLGLISQVELDYFLRLDEDFRREAFQEAFWKPRDPDPRTVENELYERWREMGGDSGQGVSFRDPRMRLFLFNGPPGGWTLPDGRPASRCFSRQRQVEIWFYEQSERIDRSFPIVLLRRSTEKPFEVYLPGETLRPVQHTDRLPTTDIRLLCADELLRYALFEMDRVPGYDEVVQKALAPPVPSLEWLASFSGSDTEPPEDAERFTLDMRLDFPQRNQSRTALEALLVVPRSEAPGQVFDGDLYHHFFLTGEVIRDGRRLESFRYRFEGPTPEVDGDLEGGEPPPIPLGFTRYLRPGKIELRLLLQDVYGNRYAHIVQDLDVPSPEGLESVPQQLLETNRGPQLELLAPPGRLHTGPMRFRARSRGELDKVTFFLDGESKLSKRKPPYSVELDLGDEPVARTVRVVGYVDDAEVATDQIWLNQGPQRFRVGFVEPRAGGMYPGGFIARIDVTTPDGRPPEKLDLYLGEQLLTTLVEGPYSHNVRLPGTEAAVLRAVAHLQDGSQTEDAVIVNTALSETVEVRLVELPVIVKDRSGEPMPNLTVDAFQLFEGPRGELTPQPIERLIAGTDAVLSTALMVDRSASMEPHLPIVREAAAQFTAIALGGDADRMAIYSFAERLRVDADLTPQEATVQRALAGLLPGGSTALYDSLVEALQSLKDAGGPAVLVLFTDGQDEVSRLTFEQTKVALARSGVSLYSVALAEAFPGRAERRPLKELSEVSGGQAFFLDSLDGLPEVYSSIAAELRSRYLVTFQPPAGASGPRVLRLEVAADGAEVRTRSEYLP